MLYQDVIKFPLPRVVDLSALHVKPTQGKGKTRGRIRRKDMPAQQVLERKMVESAGERTDGFCECATRMHFDYMWYVYNSMVMLGHYPASLPSGLAQRKSSQDESAPTCRDSRSTYLWKFLARKNDLELWRHDGCQSVVPSRPREKGIFAASSSSQRLHLRHSMPFHYLIHLRAITTHLPTKAALLVSESQSGDAYRTESLLFPSPQASLT
jgi:hypothetical protein